MTRPLEFETLAAVAFGLGAMTATAPSKRPPGALSELARELDARGVLHDLLDTLSPPLQEALTVAMLFDRTRARRRFYPPPQER